MPYETITIGRDKWKAAGPSLRLMRHSANALAEQFSVPSAVQRLLSTSPKMGPILDTLRLHPKLFERIVDLLEDVALNHSHVIHDSFRSFDFTGMDGSTIEVPSQLWALADIDAKGTGKGELLVPLLVAQDVTWHGPNAPHDLTIDAGNWGFKDHRTCDSTPIGRSSQVKAFLASDVMGFIGSLGLNPLKFGVEDFEDERVEIPLKKRYGTADLLTAAIGLEEDLQSSFRTSGYFDDILGHLYLKQRKDGSMFIDVTRTSRLCFHSSGDLGFKVCDEPDRFMAAVMKRTTDQIKQREKERLAALRLEEKEKLRQAKEERDEAKRIRKEANETLRTLNREKRDRARVAAEIERQRLRDVRADLLKRFVSVVPDCVTMVEVADRLGIKDSLAHQLKKEAIAAGVMVSLKPKERKIKNAGRNRGRKHEAGDQGSLGADTAGIKGKRRRKADGVAVRQEDEGRGPDDQGIGHAGGVGEVPNTAPPSERQAGDGRQPDQADVRAAG